MFAKICERKNSSVVVCENCGLQFVHPLLDEETIHLVHGEEMTGTQKGTPYYREYFEERKRRAGSYEKIYSSLLDLIERILSTKGNLLDVGCRAGFFVKCAMERGWNTHGIDLLPEYEVLARQDSLTFEKRDKSESLGGRIGFALKRDLKNFFNPITCVNPLLNFSGYGFNRLILAKKTASPEEP
ncbi:MAG: hypothetical protein COV66_02880 [Nitrospinae bacterium CG11_big_fil_rev_8_21_14_0_20_45_15]|nr:MAG: hypothetical protein COV66_02880 [Nitrospinae bacterium CG11_big_fil_rev_8_21_14_0_20_45_15]